MPKTGLTALMKFSDNTARTDAEISTEYNADFGDLSIFAENAEKTIPAYGTLEKNFYTLDGSHEAFPDEPSIAFWSLEESDENAEFSDPPKLEISFSDTHTSSGITFYFAEDYPTEVFITWYDSYSQKIISETFYPDALTYSCNKQVKNYKKIVIEFKKTRMPFRNVKLAYILYGIYMKYSGEFIMSATAHEEIDITSDTIAINTAKLQIHDSNNEFDTSNDLGLWKSVQRDQEILLTEQKDGVDIKIGNYYIDTHSFKDNVAEFSLIDGIGKVDRYTFNDGEIYDNVPAGTILDAIFAVCGVKYEISDELASIPLSGHLAILNCRSALQMVCFAINAVADSSRGDTIKIYRPDRAISATVEINRKISGETSTELEDYVSGVSITTYKYTLNADKNEVYNETLDAGTYTIEFNEPCNPGTITATGCTITAKKTNYAIITVPKSGSVVITAQTYDKKSSTRKKTVDVLDAGEAENIKAYDGITLSNATVITDKLDSLLSYHKLRQKINMQFFVDAEAVGNWMMIDTITNNKITAIMKSQDIDLAGGYISTASCIGYSYNVVDYMYSGIELYAGDGGII